MSKNTIQNLFGIYLKGDVVLSVSPMSHSHENGNAKPLIQNGFPLSPEVMPVAVGMTIFCF